MSFKTMFAGVLAAAFLAACGSSVKLDDKAAVTDGKSELVSASNTVPSRPVASTNTAVVSERGVASVNVTPQASNATGPAGVGKVILFDYDSFAIKPEYQSAIDAHAKYLVANKARALNVEGHTDERGGREYNLALGQKRAEAVRRALSLLGVPETQMEAVSYGKEKPADAAATEEAYAKNRRAELAYR